MSNITIPLDSATDAALDEIADATKRSKSDVAADLLAGIAGREADIIAKIKRGLEDVRTGRTVEHADAMARLRKTARGE
ncbi:MAG: ribbon-helix-helix protein, CopG family [Hyphomonadaceae bacterium]